MIDAILSWPRYADYPLWRKWLAANRARLGKVLIVFTEHTGGDLSDFVRANVQATFIDSPPVKGDWRDTAVNAALQQSSAEWVWFTEQDLMILDPERFWPRFDRDAYGFREDNGRWHPASLFVRRALVERTTRYFGTPPVDHFWTFSQELDALTKVGHLRGFTHQQGLSQNHYLLESGSTTGFFRRDRWRDYLRGCLEAGVPLEPGWEARARQEIA